MTLARVEEAIMRHALTASIGLTIGMLSTPALAQGVPLSVPSDARASYLILSVGKNAAGNVEIVTRRDGSSGVSYSKREVDCGSMLFRYLGSGDTPEEMQRGRPDQRMAGLVTGSISDVVSRTACQMAASK
jgi:hypothetical protein